MIFLDNMPKIAKYILSLFVFPYLYIAKKTMKNASAICSISDSNLKWCLNFSKRKKNNFDINIPLTSPNYQLTSKEREKASLWFLKRGVLRNKIHKIIYIGSFSSKNFDFDCIFDAAEILMSNKINCEFILCGYGELTDYLKKKAKKNKMVKILEPIDAVKMSRLSELSSLFIAPYRNNQDFKDSIPNKINDALRLGIPLLCPLKGEVKNLINSYNVGISYTNSKSLSKSVELLIKNPLLKKKISNNSKKLYQDKFEFNKNYNRLVQNLEQLNNYNKNL